jgi:hypothetical protein
MWNLAHPVFIDSIGRHGGLANAFSKKPSDWKAAPRHAFSAHYHLRYAFQFARDARYENGFGDHIRTKILGRLLNC